MNKEDIISWINGVPTHTIRNKIAYDIISKLFEKELEFNKVCVSVSTANLLQDISTFRPSMSNNNSLIYEIGNINKIKIFVDSYKKYNDYTMKFEKEDPTYKEKKIIDLIDLLVRESREYNINEILK